MRAALHIAAKDLRQRRRDRSALVVGFVTPLVIAALMSAAFTGTEEFHVVVGVVDEDGGELATSFVAMLEGPELADIVTVERLEHEADARAEVAAGDVDAAYVLPAGLTAAARSGTPVPLEVLTSVDAALGGEVVQAIAQGFVSRVNAVRLSVATVGAEGGTVDADLVAAAGSAPAPETVEGRSIGSRQLRPISYYAPGMAIFFVLFAVGFTARSYFVEQAGGTIDRITAAPVGPGTILAGKVLATAVYATGSLATMWTVTSLAFGADWGPPLAAAGVGLAMVTAVAALAALVITLAGNQRQAESYASVTVFVLALLGGNFVFVSAAPEAMRRLSLLTPNGWAMRAYTDFATGGATAANVVTPILAILGFSAVVGTVAAVLAVRRAGR